MMSFDKTVERCSTLANIMNLDLSYPELIMCSLYVELSAFPAKGNPYLFNLKNRFSNHIPFYRFDSLICDSGLINNGDSEDTYAIISSAFDALHNEDLDWMFHLRNSFFFRDQLKRDDIDSEYGEDNRYFVGEDVYSNFFNEDCRWSFFDNAPYPVDTGVWPIRNHYIIKGRELSKDAWLERCRTLTFPGNARIRKTICLIWAMDGFFEEPFEADNHINDIEEGYFEVALGDRSGKMVARSIEKDARMVIVPDRIVADDEYVLQDFFLDDPEKQVKARVLHRIVAPITKEDYSKSWLSNILGLNGLRRYNLPQGKGWDVGFFEDPKVFFSDSTTLGTSSKVPQEKIEKLYNILVDYHCIEPSYDTLVSLACRLTGRKLVSNPKPIRWVGPNKNELPFLIWRLSLDRPHFKLCERFFDNFDSYNASRMATRNVRKEFIDALDDILEAKTERKPDHG